MPDLAGSGPASDGTGGIDTVSGLQKMVALQQATVARTPAGHPGRADALERFGLALIDLYEGSGQSSALALAVEALRSAVTLTPTDGPARAGSLHNLAHALHLQAVRAGDHEAAAEAARTFRAALAAAPAGHRHCCAILIGLSTALRIMWIGTEDDAVLEEAVARARDAVGHADATTLADALYSLCLVLEAAGSSADDTDLLTEAVEVGRRMVKAAPVHDPARGGRLNALGTALRALATRNGEQALAVEAAEVLAESGGLLTADPAIRIVALSGAAVLAGGVGGNPGRALALVEEAVRLLPRLADPSQAPVDREHRLGLVESLAGIAAASAIAAGRPLRAVELLEQTRGVLINDTIQARDNPSADVRAVPDVRSLAARTAGIPVVFVTSSPLGGNALIVSDDQDMPVRVVPLPGLSDDDVTPAVIRLTNGYITVIDPPDGHPFRAMLGEGMLFRVFRWMWDVIAEPVLRALGHVSRPDDEDAWPRVRWCPTGMLAHLPIHAAGHHTDISAELADRPDRSANPRTVLDRVVSSYVPGLRALAHTGSGHGLPTDRSALIVTAPAAPGVPRLHGAAAETAILVSLVPDARTLPVADRESVLAALPAFHLTHFICHGVTDWHDPASSHLVLADGQDARLTVADLGRLQLTGGLAYLSACGTRIPGVATPDEGMHLTGAFHLAGYRHVVGTLWPVNDFVARSITESFYAHLTADGAAAPDVDRSAVALHRAVRRVRERHLTSPTLWAAHTHTGF